MGPKYLVFLQLCIFALNTINQVASNNVILKPKILLKEEAYEIFTYVRLKKKKKVMIVDAISNYDEMVSIENTKLIWRKESERKRLATNTYLHFDPNSIINITVDQLGLDTIVMIKRLVLIAPILSK